MNEVSLAFLASIGGLAILIMVLLGMLVKPVVDAKWGEDWKWRVTAIHGSAFTIGVTFGILVFVLLFGLTGENALLGFVNGCFAAASSVGIYKSARGPQQVAQ
jgi:hypothetical protein